LSIAKKGSHKSGNRGLRHELTQIRATFVAQGTVSIQAVKIDAISKK
jgi:hypothetical protein